MSVGEPWLRWRLEDERKHTYAAPWRKDCACETCRAVHPEHWITFAALDPACVLPTADERTPIFDQLLMERCWPWQMDEEGAVIAMNLDHPLAPLMAGLRMG